MVPGIYTCFKHWDNQTIWVISDTHFGDESLKAAKKNRPSDDELVKNINKCVGKNDTLIVLGDVGSTDFVKKLKGYKVLLTGNHDLGASNYKHTTKYETFKKDEYTKEQAVEVVTNMYPGYFIHCSTLLDHWVVEADNKLFDEIYTGPLMIGEKLLLSHEPISVTWAYNIHGHEHSHQDYDTNHSYNVCCDVCNYTPLNLNRFLKGGLSHVQPLHRATIDRATERRIKRGYKLGEKK